MAFIGDNAIEVEPVETDNIGSLANLMIAELPGVSDLMVRQQLGFALREFCRETDACVLAMPTEAWPNDCLAEIDRATNWWGGRYNIPAPPQGMEIGTILELALRDGKSVPFKIATVPHPYIFTPEYVYSYEDRMAIVRFSVVPKVGGEACPKWFKERYAEAIVAGAMFHLLSMTGKAWSNPQRAAQYGGKYHEAIGEAAYRRIGGSAVAGGTEYAIPAGGLFM